MNIQQSIKFFSAAALMSLAVGCSSSKQVAKTSNSSEVYDDMYASADESRPASLTSREKYYDSQNEEDYTTRNPEYRGRNNTNAQGTDEYYSQNWINSRQYYQNQVPLNNNGWNNGFNNGWNNGFNGGWNSPFNNYGWNNWGRPGISIGLGFGNAWGNPWNSPWNDPWNSYAFGGGFGGFNSWGYDPWGWGGSRWGWGNGFNTGWNSWGGWGNNFYDPWGGWGGRRNTVIVNNYGTGVVGANGNYSNPTTTRPARVRDTYSSSAYNGDYNSNRSGTITRQNRTDNTYSGSGDYYSRPSRNNSYSNSSGNTSTYSNGNSNSNSSNRSNSSWNWSNGNSNSGNSSNSNSRTSSGSSSWGGSSGSSSGGSSGGGGGGGSRGPR